MGYTAALTLARVTRTSQSTAFAPMKALQITFVPQAQQMMAPSLTRGHNGAGAVTANMAALILVHAIRTSQSTVCVITLAAIYVQQEAQMTALYLTRQHITDGAVTVNMAVQTLVPVRIPSPSMACVIIQHAMPVQRVCPMMVLYLTRQHNIDGAVMVNMAGRIPAPVRSPDQVYVALRPAAAL